MRCIATVSGRTDVVRVMLCESGEDGVYLFLYSSEADCSADGDEFYESVADAKKAAQDSYGVDPGGWTVIPDPLEHCQGDWQAPVRVAGRADGAPRWGELEVLRDGEWVPLTTA